MQWEGGRGEEFDQQPAEFADDRCFFCDEEGGGGRTALQPRHLGAGPTNPRYAILTPHPATRVDCISLLLFYSAPPPPHPSTHLLLTMM